MRFLGTSWMLVLGLSVAVGCGGGNSDYKKNAELKKAPALGKEHDHHDHDHGHGSKGPHGGSLVELGEEEYHGEVVVDDASHTLRVFVLGGDAKSTATTTATEVTLNREGKDPIKLKGSPVEGDGEGKTSRFELSDEKLIHELLEAGAIHGSLQISIGDKAFKGEVDYHLDHIHHEHKDAEHKDEKKPEAGEKPAPESKDADTNK